MSSVSTAIIPVAGVGSRIYPASKAVPKALLPVMDRDGLLKPLLHVLVAEALSAGTELVVVVTAPEQKPAIARYFHEPTPPRLRRNPELDAAAAEIEAMQPHLLFVVQESPEGFGHAVLSAREYIRRGPVLVLVGDHVFRVPQGQPTCATQITRLYEKHQSAIVGVERVDLTWADRLAFVQGDPLDDTHTAYRVRWLKEKPGAKLASEQFRMPSLPSGTWLGTFGMDVLTPPIFDILDYNVRNNLRTHGEIQLRDAMETLVLLEGMVAGVIEGERLDVGESRAWLTSLVRQSLDGPHRDALLAEFHRRTRPD
jgi:UTP--glucose-1-phosphate uridylyltransferase